jgi:hypothetical protein
MAAAHIAAALLKLLLAAGLGGICLDMKKEQFVWTKSIWLYAHSLKPWATFRDCANGCPEMIIVPSGSFAMGSPATEAR